MDQLTKFTVLITDTTAVSCQPRKTRFKQCSQLFCFKSHEIQRPMQRLIINNNNCYIAICPKKSSIHGAVLYQKYQRTICRKLQRNNFFKKIYVHTINNQKEATAFNREWEMEGHRDAAEWQYSAERCQTVKRVTCSGTWRPLRDKSVTSPVCWWRFDSLLTFSQTLAFCSITMALHLLFSVKRSMTVLEDRNFVESTICRRSLSFDVLSIRSSVAQRQIADHHTVFVMSPPHCVRYVTITLCLLCHHHTVFVMPP